MDWVEDSRGHRQIKSDEWDHTAQHDLNEAHGALQELQEAWRRQKAERQARIESKESNSQ